MYFSQLVFISNVQCFNLLIIELRFDVLIFNWMYFYCFLSVNNLPNKKIVGQIVLMFRLDFLKRHT